MTDLEREYELLLADRTIATWQGTSGENAARRYVACKPAAIVIAWREVRHGLYLGIRPIKEP